MRQLCSHLQGASLWAWMDLPKEPAMDSMLPGASSEGARTAHFSSGKEPQAASLTSSGRWSKPGCLVPQAGFTSPGHGWPCCHPEHTKKARVCHHLSDKSLFPAPKTTLTIKPSCSYWMKAPSEGFAWVWHSQKGVRQTSPLSVLMETNALNQLSHFSC